MNEKVKNMCKNYSFIVNCEFLDDDLFSYKLVEFYKKAISRVTMDDSKSLDKISNYDRVMKKYIEDYEFSKNFRDSIDVSTVLVSKVDLTNAVLDYAVDFSSKYNDDVEKPIINTRWI